MPKIETRFVCPKLRHYLRYMSKCGARVVCPNLKHIVRPKLKHASYAQNRNTCCKLKTILRQDFREKLNNTANTAQLQNAHIY
jgi:hypothetical protein